VNGSADRARARHPDLRAPGLEVGDWEVGRCFTWNKNAVLGVLAQLDRDIALG